MMDEERLLIEAAQKDPRRFGELYERNFERVYAFIARRVRDRHEAEDITAEVFHLPWPISPGSNGAVFRSRPGSFGSLRTQQQTA